MKFNSDFHPLRVGSFIEALQRFEELLPRKPNGMELALALRDSVHSRGIKNSRRGPSEESNGGSAEFNVLVGDGNGDGR